MVNIGTVSTSLLLFASTAAAAWTGNPVLGGQEDGLEGFEDIPDQQLKIRENIPRNGGGGSVPSGPGTADVRLEPRVPHPTAVTENPASPPAATPEASFRLSPRQDSTVSDGAAPPSPSPPTIPIPSVTDPSASAIIASLSASATLALSSQSISFQQQISSLSLKSSADISSLSSSASSALAAAVATNSAISSSIAVSASSAGASIASSSAAASASSVIAAIRSSLQGTTISASTVLPTTTSASSVSSASSAMSTTTSAEAVQPSTSPADGATFVVTSSQITAIAVGTFVASAIITLVLVCFIASCRKKRAKRYAEKGLENSDSANTSGNEDGANRAEGDLSRQERGAVYTSGVISRSSAASSQAPAPQRPQAGTQRSNLPTLVEESPPVSATLNLSRSGGNAPARSEPSDSMMSGGRAPEQAEPEKVSIWKRLGGRGNSKGKEPAQPTSRETTESTSGPSDITTPASRPGDFYSRPGPPQSGSQVTAEGFQLPRTPSSDTLQVLRKKMASPLTLNPPNEPFSPSDLEAIPRWTAPKWQTPSNRGSARSKTPSNMGTMNSVTLSNTMSNTMSTGPDGRQRRPGSQYLNRDVRSQVTSQMQSPESEDPYVRAERQLSHIAFMVSQKHMEEQQRNQPTATTSQDQQPGAQSGRNLIDPGKSSSSNNNGTSTAAASVDSNTVLAAPVPRRLSIVPLPPVSPFSETFDGEDQAQNDEGAGDPSRLSAYISQLAPPPRSPLRRSHPSPLLMAEARRSASPPPPPPRSPLRKLRPSLMPNERPPVSPLSPLPNGGAGPDDVNGAPPFSPMPSWRSSYRNSYMGLGAENADAVGLAQATAGLGIVDNGKGKGKAVAVNANSPDSSPEGNGGRYTWRESTDGTAEANNGSAPKSAIGGTWASGGPLMEPSPAEFASAASLETRRSRSTARLTLGRADFPAPLNLPSTPVRDEHQQPNTPRRFSLFPRTDENISPSVLAGNLDLSRMNTMGSGVPATPVDSGSRLGSRKGHTRNKSSLSSVDFSRRERRSSIWGAQAVNG